MSKLLLLLLASIIGFTSCSKEADPEPEPKPFSITDYFVAGTLSQKSGSKYTSVFFIRFLEDNKAVFINSGANNLNGTYTLTGNELVFEVTGGNARTARFTLDSEKKITSAYYKALTTEYNATGELLPGEESNQLAGNTFKGEEFKMGEVSNRAEVIYSFSTAATTTYGSGTGATTIDNSSNSYTLIGGRGFKHVKGSTVELGFLSNKKLTVFRSSGLFYYGKYHRQ